MAPIQHLGNIDKRKRASQQVAFGFFSFLSYLVVVILFVILGFIILKGASVISWDFLTQAPQEGMTSGGIFPAIVGTLYLVIGSSLISFPIGIMSGIYMNEYATNGKLIRFIRIMTNNLSGVPSVVFGLFGMSLFVSTLGWGDSIIAGSFTLALMSLPLIIRTTEEALKSIDDSFRHGSLALGATKIADHPQGRATDGVPQYYYGIDSFDRACVRRDRSYPFYGGRLFLATITEKYFRPMYGITLPLICYLYKRYGYRGFPGDGLWHGTRTDCHRIISKPFGECLA